MSWNQLFSNFFSQIVIFTKISLFSVSKKTTVDELWEIITPMLDASEVYTAEKILEKYGIVPLRLPPYVLFREINYFYVIFFIFHFFQLPSRVQSNWTDLGSWKVAGKESKHLW